MYSEGESVQIAGRSLIIRGDIATTRDPAPVYHATDSDGRGFLIWSGGESWARDVLKAFEGLKHPALPEILEVIHEDQEDEAFVTILLTGPATIAVPYDDDAWRAAPCVDNVNALQKLASSLATLHERGAWLQGLKKRDLFIDLVTQDVMITAVPRLHINLRPAIEAAWRDMRLLGELTYEAFMEADYPGGHQMAAVLQDKELIKKAKITYPGLPQVLAGCVSPYGDLAYSEPSDLIDGLEQLRVELHRPLNFMIGSASTVGNYLFRKNNQDSCGHISFQSICGSRKTTLGFFCVADGIGGIQDGEHASRLAVDTACQSFARGWAHYGAPAIVRQPHEFAKSVAKVVGQRLALEGEFSPGTNRGGTTFSGLVIAGRRGGVCHVGDSRIMLIRGGRLIQLTDDHTLATILIRLGELTPEQAEKNDLSQRTISRFLSTSAEIETHKIDDLGRAVPEYLGLDSLDTHGFEIRRGDLFILTSDGAHGEADVARIQELVGLHESDPQGICDALVQNALDRLGKDNSTALTVLVH